MGLGAAGAADVVGGGLAGCVCVGVCVGAGVDSVGVVMVDCVVG